MKKKDWLAKKKTLTSLSTNHIKSYKNAAIKLLFISFKYVTNTW